MQWVQLVRSFLMMLECICETFSRFEQGLGTELRALRWHLPKRRCLDIRLARLYAGISAFRCVSQLPARNFDSAVGHDRQEIEEAEVNLAAFIGISYYAKFPIQVSQ